MQPQCSEHGSVMAALGEMRGLMKETRDSQVRLEQDVYPRINKLESSGAGRDERDKFRWGVLIFVTSAAVLMFINQVPFWLGWRR